MLLRDVRASYADDVNLLSPGLYELRDAPRPSLAALNERREDREKSLHDRNKSPQDLKESREDLKESRQDRKESLP